MQQLEIKRTDPYRTIWGRLVTYLQMDMWSSKSELSILVLFSVKSHF